jgi:hypothetical protein
LVGSARAPSGNITSHGSLLDAKRSSGKKTAKKRTASGEEPL